jgi:hypothetical protein
MFRRWAESRLAAVLSDTPVALVTGPRRSGKTTLVRLLVDEARPYRTLDDQSMLDAARTDPVGFVRGLDQVVIDEVQRVPELLLAIKRAVDDDYRPGRFLLTGSANVMTLPRVADSLAGRIETVPLLPLAQGEILGTDPGFLDAAYTGRFSPPRHPVLGPELVKRVLAGGFPEALARPGERRRQDWARSYVSSVLTRDLWDIANVEKLTDLPRFVRILAEHSGQLVNFSQIAAAIGVSYKTAQRYVGLLEQVFLVATLEPWYTNRVKRLIKTPKLHFLDSGLLSSSLGLTAHAAAERRNAFGPALESFVYAEILKLASRHGRRFTLDHFRDHQKREVDIVLEREDGAISGVEIKAAATVRSEDFAGLRALAEAAGSRFVKGILLYDGETPVPFGAHFVAAPLSCLWD